MSDPVGDGAGGAIAAGSDSLLDKIQDKLHETIDDFRHFDSDDEAHAHHKKPEADKDKQHHAVPSITTENKPSIPDIDTSFKEKKHVLPEKFSLFGRQQPVHSALGGGKSADIVLWRNKQVSAGLLAAATVIWLLFEWIGYHLLTFVCHSLMLTLAVMFLWSNLSSFVHKSPPEFPNVILPEEVFLNIALLVRDRFNLGIALFREVAQGKDLKMFFQAIIALWFISVVGSWFDFLTLTYIMFVMLFTLPMLYEMHEEQVDAYAEKATIEIKKQYNVLDEKVLQKLPKFPLTKSAKQH